ncbi:hypothetical protein IW139_001603 [Coemansia sp. RSA 353]|nr:hypothetical protein J3F81_003146 [Coemansia sp. RSA 371]KAJ2299635.1 hypothetical protein IW139_001603 [Coemansia sp. RSA 353]KAJ2410267.1 hypothetical protein J3F80_000694 [Coemansia sp. RSA 2526]
MSEFPWQSPQMQSSAPGPDYTMYQTNDQYQHDATGSSEAMLLNASMGAPYEPVKSENPDEAFSSLMSAPPFYSPTTANIDRKHQLGFGNVDLYLNTTPNMQHTRLGDNSNYDMSNMGSANDMLNGINVDSMHSSAQPGTGSDEGNITPEPYNSQNKKRTRLRPEQTRKLLEVFAKITKPDSEARKSLGTQLGMNPRAVQIWFQNRRAKMKRESSGTGALKHYSQHPLSTPNSRNRLTFNNSYLSRRQPGRVVSDNIEHMRNSNTITPFSHEGFYGLPLQDPSHISVPLDMPMHLPFNGAEPHRLDHGAMAVPIGHHNDGMYEGRFPGYPDHSTGQALSSVLPLSARGNGMFSDAGRMHPGEPLGFTPGHAMPPQDFAPAAMHMHNPQNESEGKSMRMRSFTADSHTLPRIGQVSHNPEFSFGGPGEHGLAQTHLHHQIADGPQHQMHMGHHMRGPPMPQNMGSDVPSADTLLKTRNRHLQDLIIINQTHAAREMQAKGIVPTTGDSADIAGAEQPLLFTELSRKPSQSSNLSVPANTYSGGNAVQDITPSSCAPAPKLFSTGDSPALQLEALPAQGGMANFAFSAATGQQPSTCVDNNSGARPADLAAHAPRQNSGYVDQPTGDIGTSLFGLQQQQQPDPASSGSEDGSLQYQVLHDILLQYTAMEFAGKSNNGYPPPQAAANDSFILSFDPTSTDPAFDNLPISMSKTSSGTSPSGQSSGSKATSSFSKDSFGSSAQSSSHLLSSTARGADSTPVSAFTVTSSGSEKLVQSKSESNNVVSVASGSLVGQRELMIEQMPLSSAQY